LHEASITQALVDQVRSFVPEGASLLSVRIEVGALEHLDADVLRWTWDVFTEGTDLSGAKLEIESVPLRVCCRACGHEWLPEDPAVLVCPACEAVLPDLQWGTGVLLRSLEVEETGDEA